MSVRMMTAVFDHSESRLADRLVLLVIADRSDDDGAGCWRGKESIARMARVSRSTVTDALNRLQVLGELVVTPRAGRTNKYRIMLPGVGQNPAGSDGVGRPDGQPTPGRDSADTRPDGQPRSIPEPSSEPSSPEALVERANEVAEKAKGPRARAPFGGDPIKVEADALTRAYWEAREPKPTVRFVAIRGIVETALRAHWSGEQVAWALPRLRYISGAALGAELERRYPPTVRSSPTNPSGLA